MDISSDLPNATNLSERHPEISPAPIRSILVPLDGSRLAEGVLPAVRTLGERLGATVTLLHVLERDAPETVHGHRHLRDEAEAAAYLAALVPRIASSPMTVRTNVHESPENDVAGSIVKHAEEFDTDLIALASHGSGGFRGFLFGRIAQQVLRRGVRPVFVEQVRETGPEDPLARPFVCRTAAIALNGTAEAEAPLPLMATLARALGATVHLIYAVPTLGTVDSTRAATATLVPGTTRALLQLEEENAAHYLAAVAAEFGRLDVEATAAVVRGEPADAVVAEAERVPADLLALASHGRAGLSGIWAGSVGTRILSRFHRPLLLVRAPD
jgi:nucleotide-binding universal stress UspA family protein